MKRKMTFILVLSVWLILCAAVTYLSVWAFPMVREEMNIDTVINLLGDDCADIGSGMLILQWKNWKGELTVNFYKPDATFKVDAFSISRSALFVSVYAICAVAFIITTAFLVVLFLKKEDLIKMKTIRKTVFLILLCIFVFSSCSSGREYYDDIVVQFENDEAEIVIREWRFLLGSGAEIYCNIGGKMTLLGQISGMDNGFCPFSKGLYSVELEGGIATIRYAYKEYQSEKNISEWRCVSYSIGNE